MIPWYTISATNNIILNIGENVSSLQEPNGYGAAAAGNGYSAGESGAASTVKSNQSDGSIINSRDSPNNTKMFVGGISKNTNTGKK